MTRFMFARKYSFAHMLGLWAMTIAARAVNDAMDLLIYGAVVVLVAALIGAACKQVQP